MTTISADDVREAAQTYKPTRQIAAELGTTTRTIQRKLDELRAAGYVVRVKLVWDGGHKRSTHYRVVGRGRS